MTWNMSITLIAVAACSFAITFFSILWLSKSNVPKILDYPNARSLHINPTPKLGGIGLLLGIIITWALFSVTLPAIVWLGAGLLVAISLADDISNLSVWKRLTVHGMVASGVAIALLSDSHHWIIVCLAAFAIIWLANLYNFMDGSDGLAGGMAVIGFSSYGLIALLAENKELAIINFSIAAAALAFLIYNFHPARIFMGDTGSIFLGFMAAVIGVIGWIDGLWVWCLPIVLFFPFIADATMTLIKRSVRQEKVWRSHCEHYYQRIIQSGFGHRNTALFAYILMLLTATSGVWATQQSFLIQHWVATIWTGIYLLAMLLYDRHKKISN